KVPMGTTPRLRHEDKGPLHHTWTDDLRPFGTGMAEPLHVPIFHIADVLGRSATIATPRPQRTIRRAGVGPEQDCYDPGPRMGINFGRLPPREGKAAPGFLWREAKQRTSRRRLLHTHHRIQLCNTTPHRYNTLTLDLPGDSGSGCRIIPL